MLRYRLFWYFLINIAVSFVLVFAVQIAATSYTSAVVFSGSSPREWCFTAIFIFTSCLFFDSLTGRKYIAIAPICCVISLLAIISGQKYGYRSEPLYPWDFLFVDQVFDLLPLLLKEHPLSFSFIVALLSFLIVAMVAAVLVFARSSKMESGLRIGLGASSLIILMCFIYSISPRGSLQLYKATKIMNMAWDQSINYPKNGFLLAFSFSLNSALISKPAVGIESVLSSFAPVHNSSTSDNGDVVIVMNESFWDATKLPGIKFTPDPMPTVRRLQKGEVFSPVYGGGTANVEFEALTGFSNSFLPAGSLPYQQYIIRNTPSIIWALRNIGYRSIAIHPYHRWFWNRESVYSKLGFEKFISLEQMSPDQSRGPFFADEALSAQILRTLEESEKPTVIFAVTMQNHGPYERNRYTKKNINLKINSNIDLTNEDGLQTYAEGINDGDLALNSLVLELSKRKRRTLLVFFGDHLPMMGHNLDVFKKTGFISGQESNLNAVELKKMRTTPLVIWSNVKNDFEDQGVISPSFIPNIIDQALGLNNQFYGEFLGSLRKQYNIVDQTVLGHSSGELEQNWRSKSSALLDKYQSIQYDLMFGNEISIQRLFPYFDNACCSSSHSGDER